MITKSLSLPQLLKKIIITFIILVTVIALASVAIMMTAKMKVQQPLVMHNTELLTVKPGTSFNAFSKQLISNGWIENRFWLRAYVKLNPQHSKIKSGTYQIEKNLPIIDLLDLLISGKEHQFSITFIEGSTFNQVLGQVSKHQYINQTINELSSAVIAKRLNIKQSNPEGWLFPDTYAFTKNTDDITILKRAHDKMREALNTQWQNRAENLPYDAPYQALIMASIIEKESGRHAEHPRIASVFINRLNKKMRLQTDPTVIYGLGDRYQGDITYAHLREKTAYNTYKIKGLPPTPIALPGAQALHAALNPELSEYLYFVSNGAGEHVFSTNLADHNRAVNKYQRN